MTFRATGVFLDPNGVRFWLTDPWQVAQHVTHLDPYSVVVGPVLVFVLALGIGVASPWAARRIHPAVILVSFLLLGVGDRVAGGWVEDGRRAALSEVYDAMRIDRAGPVTHLVEYARIQSQSPLPPHPPRPDIVVSGSRIEPLREYADRVDPDSVQNWDVIVLLVESLRLDELQYGGAERKVMLTVDAIAREARAYTFNYSQASHSNYADVAALAGHYPLRGFEYHVYPENPRYPRVLVYDVLKQLGWRTAVFSSQNENWGGMLNYLSTGSIDTLFHAETFEGDTYLPRRDTGFEKFVKGTKRAGKVDDRHTITAAIDWIDGLGDDRYFMYVNLQNSHVPYEIPADFDAPFGSGEVSFPLRFGSFPRDSVDAVKDLYASSLAYVDAQVARLVTYLQSTGRWDRTVLVVTGDTGQAFYEHGFAAHANALYDEVLRVPLVIRAPGMEARFDNDPAQHIDIPPTVLRLLGLPNHDAFQGVSLLEPRSVERPLYLVAQTALAHQYAIVQNRWKLIWDARLRRFMLYDLRSDPGETTDLSEQQPKTTHALAGLLRTWIEEQVDYYRDWPRQKREYPPRFEVRNQADESAIGERPVLVVGTGE